MRESRPEVVFMNNELNYFDDNNVFDYIETKAIHGVRGSDEYLTPIGNYIVFGSPFYSGWEEYAKEYYHKLEECSEQEKATIKDEYDNYKETWLKNCNLQEDDLSTLDLLHEQYLAIKQLSHDPNNEDAKTTIIDTYEKTGENVLSFLVRLKTQKQWCELTDQQGRLLCFVLTGKDPFFSVSNLYEIKWYIEHPILFGMDSESMRRIEDMISYYNSIDEIYDLLKKYDFLFKMHGSFIDNKQLIDEICKEKRI